MKLVNHVTHPRAHEDQISFPVIPSSCTYTCSKPSIIHSSTTQFHHIHILSCFISISSKSNTTVTDELLKIQRIELAVETREGGEETKRKRKGAETHRERERESFMAGGYDEAKRGAADSAARSPLTPFNGARGGQNRFALLASDIKGKVRRRACSVTEREREREREVGHSYTG